MKYILIILVFFSLKGSTQAPPLSLFTGAQEYQLRNYVKYVVDSAGAQIKKDYTYQDYLRSAEIEKLKVVNKQQSDSIKSLYDSLATYVYTVADLDPIIKRIEALEVRVTVQGRDIDILKQYMEEQKKKFLELGLWQPTN